MTTTQKHQLCAAWLSACLRLGWPKSSLDALECIFWDCEGWRYFRDSREPFRFSDSPPQAAPVPPQSLLSAVQR